MTATSLTDPHNPAHHLALARAYLEAGQEDKARDVVVSRRHLPSDDPAVHRAWAELCQDLGMARQAQDSLQQALKLQPDDIDTLLRLSDLLADVGRYEESIRYLKKALRYDPQHQEAREILADHYRTLGLVGRGEALFTKPKTAEPVTAPRYFPPAITDEAAAALYRLFEGREIGFAFQTIDPHNGQVAFHYQDAHLTPKQVKAHLQGEMTLAVYPLRIDNTVKYTGVSIRLSSGVLETNVKNTGFLTFLKERMQTYILALGRAAAQFKIPAYPEDTGEYQFRIWFFFNRFIHFLKAKSFIQDFIKQIPAPEGYMTVEPILPTKQVGFGWMEHPLMLPLGINPATTKRSLFLDPAGPPCPDQLKQLKKIRETAPARVFRLAGLSGAQGHSATLSIPRPACPFQVLLAKCAVLRELGQKSRAGRLLRSEEKAILFYTVGLIEGGEERLHYLFEPCPDYQYDKIRRQAQRLKPNPISCLKIREWIPDLTASFRCNCTFDLRGGKYPSPLLHVDPHAVPSAMEFEPTEGLPLREIAQAYVRIRQHGEEVNRTQRRLETVMDDHFKKKQISRLKTRDLFLVRETVEGQTHWRLEYA